MSALAATRTTSDRVAIRAATPADAPALEATEAASFRHDRLSPRALLPVTSARTAPTSLRHRLAATSSAIASFSTARATKLARLYSIATAPAARGRALAGASWKPASARAQTRVRPPAPRGPREECSGNRPLRDSSATSASAVSENYYRGRRYCAPLRKETGLPVNNDWILIADDLRDLASPRRALPHDDHARLRAAAKLLSGARPKIINLARNYNYQTDGYYASLLGEARGHRVIPTVETMLDLYDRDMHEDAISVLEELLNKDLDKFPENGPVPERIVVCFGEVGDERFRKFARQIFDWYRAPVLVVTTGENGEPGKHKVKRIKLTPFHRALKTRRWNSSSKA